MTDTLLDDEISLHAMEKIVPITSVAKMYKEVLDLFEFKLLKDDKLLDYKEENQELKNYRINRTRRVRVNHDFR